MHGTGGVHGPGGVCSRGVSAPGGCLLPGGVCSRGVSAPGGCMVPGGVCSGAVHGGDPLSRRLLLRECILVELNVQTCTFFTKINYLKSPLIGGRALINKRN